MKKIARKVTSPFSRFGSWFKRSSWKKRIMAIVVIGIAGFIIFNIVRPKPLTVTTETVTRDSVSDVVSESGNIQAPGQFSVYSTSTGYIEERYVQNGDMVKTGDELFKVKSTATPQEQAAALASYQSAVSAQKTSEQIKVTLQATLEKDRAAVLSAQNDVDYKNSNSTNPTTRKDYTELEKQVIDSTLTSARQTFTADEKKYLEADSAIASAKAQLSSASLSYQATQTGIVTAPAPGTVVNFSASVGDRVSAPTGTSAAAASLATSATPALVILSNLSKYSVSIPLNEVDIDKINVGQTATLTFDAFRDRKYEGRVKDIDTAGTNTSGVITYNAYITIDNPDARIKPAMTVTVEIETAKHSDVLTVSNSAIKPYKGAKAVIVAGANRETQVKDKTGKALPYHYVPVKTGLKGITKTEILSGVAEGTVVVKSGI